MRRCHLRSPTSPSRLQLASAQAQTWPSYTAGPAPPPASPSTRFFSIIASSSKRPSVGVEGSNSREMAFVDPRTRRHDATRIEQRRTFFGIGEILGVITNPGEVLRSLAESRKLLEEARQEMKENSEREQIPASHTFSPLPGFFSRPNEIQALERALGGVPAFTVLFGASSVGKTALLRQVLSTDKYHVLHMDLRIAGFADLQSLYFSLATQLEGYFAAMPELMGAEWGWGAFEKESWAFKHDRLAIEKRVEAGGIVKTSDIAHLMELFQSALLKYWEFEPMSEATRKRKADEAEKAKEVEEEAKMKAKRTPAETPVDKTEATMREGWGAPAVDLQAARSVKSEEEAKKQAEEEAARKKEEDEEPKPPPKKIPVFFLDEAHKLPALIQAQDAMKSLLDSMLVLTKQDRLCHVLHSTSDSFYMHWLRQMNIMQHCHILSIGDCAKDEARAYFEQDLMPHVPEKLQSSLRFDELYRVFGGKLAHLADYTTEFVNCDGELTPLESSHFLQAHSLLNLQLIHSMPTKDGEASSPGFEIYSPLANASPHAAPSPFNATESVSPTTGSDFSNQDLLLVMKRLAPRTHPDETSSLDEIGEIPYFPLCREIGARAVDGMVRGRILELRWSATVTEEGDTRPGVKRRKRIIGPVLVPTTSVIRFAMGEVLREYEEVGQVPQ